MKYFIAIFTVIVISLVCLTGCADKIEGYDENFYSNRAGFSYMDVDESSIYFRNVYDGNKLYKMDKSTNAVSLLSDNLVEVSDIYAGNGCVYFSAWNIKENERDRRDIFQYDLSNNSFTCLAEAAMAPIISGNLMYFKNDDAPRDIFVKNLSTGEQTTILTNGDYEFINIIGHNLYAVSGRSTIAKYNMDTKEVKEIPTEGPPDRLQYYKGFLYFYTFGENKAIYRLSTSDDSIEKLANYNDGDFFYSSMLVTDRYIFFLGCKTIDGYNTDERGLFRYDLKTKEFKHLIKESVGLSMTTYNKLLFLFSLEGVSRYGAKITVVDFDGKKTDSYAALTAPLVIPEKADIIS